jgi:hypothetical protein
LPAHLKGAGRPRSAMAGAAVGASIYRGTAMAVVARRSAVALMPVEWLPYRCQSRAAYADFSHSAARITVLNRGLGVSARRDRVRWRRLGARRGPPEPGGDTGCGRRAGRAIVSQSDRRSSDRARPDVRPGH